MRNMKIAGAIETVEAAQQKVFNLVLEEIVSIAKRDRLTMVYISPSGHEFRSEDNRTFENHNEISNIVCQYEGWKSKMLSGLWTLEKGWDI